MRQILAELVAEKTFEPFVLVMNSGDRYEVRSFEMAVRRDDTVIAFHPRSNRKDILRFSAIAALEVLDLEAAK